MPRGPKEHEEGDQDGRERHGADRRGGARERGTRPGEAPDHDVALAAPLQSERVHSEVRRDAEGDEPRGEGIVEEPGDDESTRDEEGPEREHLLRRVNATHRQGSVAGPVHQEVDVPVHVRVQDAGSRGGEEACDEERAEAVRPDLGPGRGDVSREGHEHQQPCNSDLHQLEVIPPGGHRNAKATDEESVLTFGPHDRVPVFAGSNGFTSRRFVSAGRRGRRTASPPRSRPCSSARPCRSPR